jgi:hypothetical protein
VGLDRGPPLSPVVQLRLTGTVPPRRGPMPTAGSRAAGQPALSPGSRPTRPLPSWAGRSVRW